MGKGTSRTMAIEWTFGAEAHPDINNPIMVIEAWLRFLDSGQIGTRAIDKAWRRCYHETLQVVNDTPKKAWEGVTSAMSATILHLIQLRICPAGYSQWYRGDTDNIRDTPFLMNMDNAMDRPHNLLWIKNRLANHM